MKHIFLISGLILLFCTAAYLMVEEQFIKPGSVPVDHQAFDELLKKHVDENGWVNYKGFLKDQEALDSYLDLISNNPPDPETWTEEEQLAYWINAYNAFTIKLIMDHYPLKSIKDIQISIPGIYTVWHKEFFEIGGEPSSLDAIEHKILRKKFDEPRIHFAIVCASISCPPLRREAFTAEKLEVQLQEQGELFINDPERNKISSKRVKLSKIFSWFKGDFTKKGSLVEYLNQFSKTTIEPKAKLSYLDYDWGLNEQQGSDQ